MRARGGSQKKIHKDAKQEGNGRGSAGQNERETNDKPGTIQETGTKRVEDGAGNTSRANRSAKREIHEFETQQKEAAELFQTLKYIKITFVKNSQSKK